MPNNYESPWLPILEESSDGIAMVAPQPWRLVYANPVLRDWLGVARSEFRSCAIDEAFSVEESQRLSEALERVYSGGKSRATVFSEMSAAARSTRRVEIRLRRILVEGTCLMGMVVRECVPAERVEPATSVVGCDPLTGLADRSVLLSRMASLLGGDRADDLRFAVLFIDLDDFKQVNDAHGHLVGDRVLVEVARRLAGCVRTGDLIVRFGGDEFVALLENVSGISEIQPVIDRIDTALARPIALADGEVVLSVSVGVAEASDEHRSPEDLLQDADRAMYASKRLPR